MKIAASVGGIYTVLRSKASSSVEELGDHYILIGPYNEYTAKQEVEIFELPDGPLATAVQKLRDLGFKVTFSQQITNKQIIMQFVLYRLWLETGW